MSTMRATCTAIALFVVAGTASTASAARKCSADSVKVGPSCIDAYEASVWQVPATSPGGGSNAGLVSKLRKGKATLADLSAGGAVQLGCTGAPFNHTAFPVSFPVSGNWTPVPGSDPPNPGIYAASIAGVLPSTCTSSLQAEQACVLVGKRLITNGEWQRAAASTPDTGASDKGTTTCATNSPAPADTGSRSQCVSAWGVRDMIGNVNEWTNDWTDAANVGCDNWPTAFGDDMSCVGGNGVIKFPGAFLRGGDWGGGTGGTDAGVFTVFTGTFPSSADPVIGFRCAY